MVAGQGQTLFEVSRDLVQVASESFLRKRLSHLSHLLEVNANLHGAILVGGHLEKAVVTHTKAANLKPDNEIAYYNLSLAYHRLKDFNSAITNAEKAVTLEPNNPHPLVALAMVYLDQGDIKKARDTYKKARDLDGRYRQKWFLAHLKEAGFSQEQIKLVEKLLSG